MATLVAVKFWPYAKLQAPMQLQTTIFTNRRSGELKRSPGKHVCAEGSQTEASIQGGVCKRLPKFA